MSNLTKEQKDELVTSYAALALYDGDVSSSSSTGREGEEGRVGLSGEGNWWTWEGFSFAPSSRHSTSLLMMNCIDESNVYV